MLSHKWCARIDAVHCAGRRQRPQRLTRRRRQWRVASEPHRLASTVLLSRAPISRPARRDLRTAAAVAARANARARALAPASFRRAFAVACGSGAYRRARRSLRVLSRRSISSGERHAASGPTQRVISHVSATRRAIHAQPQAYDHHVCGSTARAR